MNCLIIAATAREIAPFLDQYRHTPPEWTAGIDVLIAGIGLTATTYHLTRQLGLKRPDLVIQAGIAGSFDREIPPGTVVAVGQDAIADESVVEAGRLRTLSDLGLVAPDQHPYKNGWLVNPDKKIAADHQLRAVKAISVNQITTDPRMIVLYEETFSPAIESMEGAALHYVCLSENIPFLQLRSISNYIGERDKTKWRMPAAIQNLNKTLVDLLQTL
ncbi:MAG: futalosine hydrolase [Chitinophagaceae bacterium]